MRRGLLHLAAAGALVGALLAGIWFLGAVVAGSTLAAVGLVALWFALIGAALERLARRSPGVRTTLRATFVAVTVTLLAAGAYTSLHVTTVDEALDTGPPASQVAPDQADDLLAPQP